MGQAAKRLIERRGESVTVREHTKTGTTDAETGYEGTTEATRSVTMVREEGRQPSTMRNVRGVEVTVTTFWYAIDGEEPVITDGVDLPRIEPADGGLYKVHLVGPSNLGVRRVSTERLR